MNDIVPKDSELVSCIALFLPILMLVRLQPLIFPDWNSAP